MTSELDGIGVVITGSAMGIGRALCVRFAELGARVAGLDLAPNDATANEVAAAGGSLYPMPCNVGQAKAAKRAIDEAAAEFGRVDVLVNNASLWNDTRLTVGLYEQQVAEFHRALDACLMGTYHCAAAVVPVMQANGGGVIVNLLTDHIRPHKLITGSPATGYDAAKFGQWRLTESWAVELAPLGIRVNGLAFGATDTPMLRSVSPKQAENAMQASDMAEAVLNIVRQGPGGPTGRTWDIGFTGTPREEYLAEIEALRSATA